MQNRFMVPNELHFIWYGNFLPQTQRGRVETWSKENPDYFTYVWYDPRLLTKEQIEQFNDWAAHLRNVKLRNISELPLNLNARYESAGPFPNYGARSDIDRLTILIKFGGLYLDTDISFRSKLEPIVAKLGFQLNVFMQASDTENEKVNEHHGVVGNDIIAAIPNCNFLMQLAEGIDQNYFIAPPIKSLEELVSNAFSRTMRTTGPDYLRKKLFDARFMNSSKQDGVLLQPCRLESKYFDCENNDMSWIKIKKPKRLLQKKIYHNMDSFLQDVAIRVSYEINHYQHSLLSSYLSVSPYILSEKDIDTLYKYVNFEGTKNFNYFEKEINQVTDNLDKINDELRYNFLIYDLRSYIVKNFTNKSENDNKLFESKVPPVIIPILQKINFYCEQHEEGKMGSAIECLKDIIDQTQLFQAKTDSNYFPPKIKQFLQILNSPVEEINIFLNQEELAEMNDPDNNNVEFTHKHEP